MKARLVLLPEPGEDAEGRVIMAEVVEVVAHVAPLPRVRELDVTYLESVPKTPAERRLGRPAVGWPLIVYVRHTGAGETASPEG